MTYTPPDPSTYSIPSAASRASVAALWLVPTVLIYVVVPYLGLTELARYGIATSYTLGFIVLAGIALAVLGAIRSFARPTRAYGPLSMLVSAFAIFYLLYLSHASTFSINLGSTGGLTLGYGALLTLFAVVPLVRIGSGLLTTLEDLTRPKERLPFDYPARGPPVPWTGAPPSGAST